MEEYMDIFEEEKDYLDYTLDAISNEIQLSNETIALLEREGNSLSYEDKKRGAHLDINAKLDYNINKIDSLKKAKLSPYFGRIDFSYDINREPLKIYIGRNGISSNNHSIVTDWRAPICSLYYDSEIGPVAYKAPQGIIQGNLNLKRQISVENGKLLDVQDTSLVTSDELLKPYLSTNAGDKMKTIIASIQKEQNAIIRRSDRDNIIVQGVAGSGKTSVALHRIAYLIYNLGSIVTSDQFLVLGPNDYFLNYVSSILPELETSPIDQKTLLSFASDYLDEKITLMEKCYKNIQKEDKIITQNIQTFKSSLDYKKIIDEFFEKYLNEELVDQDFKIQDQVIFSIAEVNKILFSSNKKYPDFNRATIYFKNKFKNEKSSIYDNLNKKYKDIYTTLPKDNPLRKKAVEESAELYNLIKKDGEKLLRNYLKRLKKSPMNLYKIFIANIDKYKTSLSQKEILLLQKDTLLLLKRNKVSFEDIPELIYINYKYTGKKIKYKYIIIDEAQDYGLFHFDVLKEISEDSRFSIYGDLAQAIYSHRSVDFWEKVNKLVFDNNCDILNLSKSYRTTIEITNTANKILEHMNLSEANPVIRHGSNVEFINSFGHDEYKVNKIVEWLNKGYKTIAIICKEETEAKKVFDELNCSGITTRYISVNDNEYSGGVFVLTSASAKGLEFDCVIINDASSNVYSEDSNVDMHLLYVASTRALHEQIVLYNKKITNVYKSFLDNINVDTQVKIKKLQKK